MRNWLLTLSTMILAVSFGSLVQGRRAVLMDDIEGGLVEKLYSKAMSKQTSGSASPEMLREARKLYREGKALAPGDLYRISAILSTSYSPADLLLAHDCSLAALVEGFRPSLRTLHASQRRLIKSIGYTGPAVRGHPQGAIRKSPCSTNSRIHGRGPSERRLSAKRRQLPLQLRTKVRPNCDTTYVDRFVII